MHILLLPIFSVIELVKRIIFMAIYPVAYAFRDWSRRNKNLLWLALDDSIYFENWKDYRAVAEYCIYGKRSALVEKYLPYNFARSFYWSAWRNSAINLMTLTENWIGPKTATIARYAWGKSFYELRAFKSGLRLPYLEVWIGSWRIQCGVIQCGRFQQQIKRIV